ncbi:MAG TPA: galactokinase [Gemmatimonadaceae bacterium]
MNLRKSKGMVPADVSALFRDAHDGKPDVVASAPGRVNLIGEHTDYNGGEVLPIAIAQRTCVAMRQLRGSHRSRVVSSIEEDTGEFNAPDPDRSGRWWDYISGFNSLASPALPAVEIAVTSDVPAGAGLSSSAALEVASAFAYAALTGRAQSLRDIALDAWRVETQFVGVSCGIMDQFASALSMKGHALHIYCDTMKFEQVPFTSTVLIFDTAVPRSLRSSDFNRRQAECREALFLLREKHPALENLASATTEMILDAKLPGDLENRALHVSQETRRVALAVRQLRENGTIDSALLYQSHESLRDLYQCSSPELDWFVDRAARERGIEGARLTGAGWGGCAIAFGSRDALAQAGPRIASDYEQAFNRAPRVWLTEASQGARIEPL